MPRIKPFCAFRPALRFQGSVETRPIENYSLGQARLLASENAYSFLHLINPELDNPYLRGSRQELVYKKIVENLELFIEDHVLVKEDKPAIYIYRIQHEGLTQTGIWTLTHIEDYLTGHIKKHELTVERREKLLAEYLEQTGIDANPVLITYGPNADVDELMERYILLNPVVDFTFADSSVHQLWIVDTEDDLNVLVSAFAEIHEVYIADGHHRIASMANMLTNKYFSTAYFNTSQVKILSYNRLVRDLASQNIDDFLKSIEMHFSMQKVDAPVVPAHIHEFGMYVDKSWYRLTALSHTYQEQDPISVLDVSILQDYVLKPILKIEDPRTDARITFEGGKTPVGELQRQVDHGNYAVAFTLYPTSVQQLIAVADANGVMPPKSTWVEPKFLVGMLTNKMRNP